MLDLSLEEGGLRRLLPSPATLVSGAEALAGGAERRFADRARDADALEQFLLGADLAKPFVLGGGQRLAGDQELDRKSVV